MQISRSQTIAEIELMVPADTVNLGLPVSDCHRRIFLFGDMSLRYLRRVAQIIFTATIRRRDEVTDRIRHSPVRALFLSARQRIRRV